MKKILPQLLLTLIIPFAAANGSDNPQSKFTTDKGPGRPRSVPADFAQSIYRQYHPAVNAIAPKENTDKSVLIGFGIEPRDTTIEALGLAKVPEEEPASQALYPVITAIDAALTIQNENNVVVAVGLSPEVVAKLEKSYKNNGKITSSVETPYIQIAKFAFKNGLDVVGIDPLANDKRYLVQSNVSEPRYKAMRDALVKISTENMGQIVIAVVDDFALSNLRGVLNTQVMRLAVDPNKKIEVPEKDKQPLTPHFSDIVLINTSYDGALEAGVTHGRNRPVVNRLREGGTASIRDIANLAIEGETIFATNPKNAAQAHVPDYAEKLTADEIVEAVEQASSGFHTPPVPAELKQDVPQP